MLLRTIPLLLLHLLLQISIFVNISAIAGYQQECSVFNTTASSSFFQFSPLQRVPKFLIS